MLRCWGDWRLRRYLKWITWRLRSLPDLLPICCYLDSIPQAHWEYIYIFDWMLWLHPLRATHCELGRTVGMGRQVPNHRKCTMKHHKCLTTASVSEVISYGCPQKRTNLTLQRGFASWASGKFSFGVLIDHGTCLTGYMKRFTVKNIGNGQLPAGWMTLLQRALLCVLSINLSLNIK